ncbi:hypothetical protein FRX31_006709 [Thalictrum thalictroides]|uniref:Reverse transcriptase zinc-binding domain-containing protein n=1 Tax=Thalictrum thalictroides TaxID=46969 RepID=A0A7J6X2Y5_THATH|nr:hypothetical protein FRX31_006709 [Thalictrum thalictroides]
MCGLLNEGITHLFFHCPIALEVWCKVTQARSTGLSVILQSLTIAEAISDKEIESWTLWYTRNDKVGTIGLGIVKGGNNTASGIYWFTGTTLLLALDLLFISFVDSGYG